jgi:putative flippase GtrA
MSKPEKLTKKENIIQAVKFTLFSASAGLIEAGVFALLDSVLHFDYWPSYLIALVLSVVWNFTLNRNYTFKSAVNVPKAMSMVLGYYAVFTPLSTWLGQVWADAGGNHYLVLIVNMLANFVTEFTFDRFVVFRGTINTKQQKSAPDEEPKTL